MKHKKEETKHDEWMQECEGVCDVFKVLCCVVLLDEDSRISTV